MAEGFDAFKFGYGQRLDPFDDQRQVDVALAVASEVRKAAGPKCDLMIDCAGIFSFQAAHRLIDGLRQVGMLFVEEPVNADTPRGLVELRRAFPDVRIAAGERLATRWAFREWLEQGAVDVIQADISHCGGIGELLRIAAYAEVYGVLMAPHNPYGPVALAANAHACAAMPNFLILEHCRHRPWFDEVQVFGPNDRQGTRPTRRPAGIGHRVGLGLCSQASLSEASLAAVHRPGWGNAADLDFLGVRRFIAAFRGKVRNIVQCRHTQQSGDESPHSKNVARSQRMSSVVQPYDLTKIVHIRGVDHPESIGIGPRGEAYATGTGCQVYRIDIEKNTAEVFAHTEARCLGSVVDADGNLYVAHTAGNVLKITPGGQVGVYATGPGGTRFLCTNYPAFDRQGNMYLSDSGDWSRTINGHIYKIPPGGGEAAALVSRARRYPQRHRAGRRRAVPLLRGDVRQQHCADCHRSRRFGRSV